MAAGAHPLLASSFLPHRCAYVGLRLFHRLLIGASGRSTIAVRRCCSESLARGMASGEPRDPPSPAHTITLPGGDPVQIVAAPGLSDADLRIAIESAVFKQWLKNMHGEAGLLASGQMCLRQVLIQGVDMFGKSVGFLKFKADVFEKETGRKIPGIVFARGPSVAVLVLLESGNETYVVLTEQARVPVGKLILEIPAGMLDDEKGDVLGTAVREIPGIVFARGPSVAVLVLLESGNETYVVLTEQARVPVGKLILEIPAGMLDDEKGDVLGTAVREVEEETGISLKTENMVNLTALLDPTTGRRVFPSPGGSDEELSLFLYRGHVAKEIIEALQGRETGLRDHGELIKVRVVAYDKLWRMTADAKALAAVALYEMAKRDGLLA